MMTIVITAFERSPDGGMYPRSVGARRGRPALRGSPCLSRSENEPEHLRIHPFGLIPTYEEGDLALFETGAIVFHIAAHHARLLPDDADARARPIPWMFGSLNTVEPPIVDLVTAKILEGDSRGPKSAYHWSRTAFAIDWPNSLPACAMPTGSMRRSARAT